MPKHQSRSALYFIQHSLMLVIFSSFAIASDVKTNTPQKKHADNIKLLCEQKKMMHIIEYCVLHCEKLEVDHTDPILELIRSLYDDTELLAQNAKIVSQVSREAPRVSRFSIAKKEDEVVRGCMIVGDNFPLTPKFQLSFPAASTFMISSKVDFTQLSLRSCILLDNANHHRIQDITRSVLVSGGDILSGTLTSSIVLVNGNVDVRSASGSIILASGRITNHDGEYFKDHSLLIGEGKNMLGLHFYHSSEDGLEASEEKGVVKVKSLATKLPLGKCELQIGDTVESVNGDRVKTRHELNRLLCRAIVTTGIAEIKAFRGKETIIAKVKLAEPMK